MNTSIPNTIDQSITINAPIERVYTLITDPKHFGTWFSEGVDGDFTPGSQPVIHEGKYGDFRLAIVDARPHNYFAYRWVSGTHFTPEGFVGNPLEHPNTLVEFFLEPVGEGTLVRVIETGFAHLPEHYASQNHSDNTGGWTYQLNALKTYAEK